MAHVGRGVKILIVGGLAAVALGSWGAAVRYGLIDAPWLESSTPVPSVVPDTAAGPDERAKLREENLALKVRNSALEIDLLGLQGSLNKVMREHDHASADLAQARSELAEARRMLGEAIEALAADRARNTALAAEHADRLAREQETAQQLARELAEARRQHKETLEKHAAEPSKLQAKREPAPETTPPAVPAGAPAAAKEPVPEFVAALGALATAFRADKDVAKPKQRLLKAAGAALGETDLEHHLASLIDKKVISSWTKYGNPSDGLGYVIVARLVDNRFMGVVNLSFGALLNGQPGIVVDVEVLDQFFPVEIRSEENWDEVRVSWFYDSGAMAGAASPHFPALRTPWTIADFLLALNRIGDQSLPPQDRTKIFGTGGKRDAVRPISLADFEKKLPGLFARFSSSADALSGQPRLNVAMHKKSATFDVGALARAIDDVDGLGAGAEAIFKASLIPAVRASVPLAGAADLYGRLAALILMPDFAIEGAVPDPDGAVRAVRLETSYSDGLGRRQLATLTLRMQEESPDRRWRLAAVKRDALLAAGLPSGTR